MTKGIDRRQLLRRGSLLAPLLGLGALASVSPAAADDTAPKTGVLFPLIGTWTVQIGFPVNPDFPAETGLFAFTTEGMCLCTNTRVRDLGVGAWRPVPLTVFGFTLSFRHNMVDPDTGTWLGTLRIEHQGAMTSATTWTAKGTGTAYDTNGKPTDVVQSTTSGVRF
ncbi:hypothetical protein [Amycolatopsis sp. lyj-90]|uniref:hypothetical protein n=1 Tax=Amycolatopsis sp. lyj-90 TaxID=2789285 RepID=UPI003979241D